MKGNIRLTSGGYTQSKKIDDSWKEGYWNHQANYFDLSGIKNPNVLILGFGGGTIASFLQEKYPGIEIDGVDLDRQMIELGKAYLGFNEKGTKIYIGDAFEFLKKTQNNYDLVIVDIFKEGTVPAYLKSVEFFKEVKKVLKKGGAVTVNRIFNLDRFFIDPFTGGKQDYKKFVRMLEGVFSLVEVLEVPSNLPSRNYLFKGIN